MGCRLNNDKIRKFRLDLDIGLTEFSEIVNISPRMISRMENDPKYNPGVLTLVKVSEYYNVTIDELIVKR